jgi:energy-coupling factor transporter ATP-binding protein EcfA2
MYSIGPFRYSFRNKEKREIFTTQNFEIQFGDFVLITGPSGAGKTTLLKMLKGVIPRYSSGELSGHVLFMDRTLADENFNSNLNEILFLFQNPFSQIIYTHVSEEFFFTMENFNFSKLQMENKKKELNEFSELNKIWERKTNELSNGECQKLVLSSLLAVGPKVLLLDEPTAFLDPEARQKFYEWLKKIKGSYTVILVDHHLKEVVPLIDYGVSVSSSGEVQKIEIKAIQMSKPDITNPTPKLQFTEFAPAKLIVRDLNFSYLSSKDKSIFHDLNFAIESGKVVVLKGKNGEGKSTLFKLISGFLKPSSGVINYIENGEVVERKKSYEHIALIMQNPESHFFFDTIKEELESVATKEIYEKWLNYFFNSLQLDKSPFLLSEGEKRRLSILLSLMQSRSVILFDEPTFGLDFENKTLVANSILSLKKMQAIQLIISHDEEFIRDVADEVYELVDGRMRLIYAN